ncbi:S66 family peptidase [Anaerorhabdus sp.]|uniref:S66 family peptidase n=1 Tax=Anaerorhabdus sp. TaxID=1872524 RepID=UPI002FCB31D5
MRIPKYIHENATIGVLAPSLGIGSEKYLYEYLKSKEKLEELGFKIIESKNLFVVEKAQSNTPKNRAKEFMKFYLDEKIDFVWSVSGGEREIEILPYLDFEKLRKANPKWFVGFSDNTNLVHTLTTKCDVASIYAMNMLECFTQQSEESSFDLLNLLLQEKTEFSQYGDEEVKTNRKNNMKFEGRLIGGNLDILMNLIGTEYEGVKYFIKKYPDFIWYFEPFDYNICGLKRCLWQMQQLGYFEKCKGILIGKMRYSEDIMGLTLDDVIRDLDVKVPVVYNVQVGHVGDTMPFMNGGYAKIEVRNKKFKITYDLTYKK